jgi:hypothetical protein
MNPDAESVTPEAVAELLRLADFALDHSTVAIIAFTSNLPTNHQGDHRHAMTACEPVAYMGWADPLENEGTTDA